MIKNIGYLLAIYLILQAIGYFGLAVPAILLGVVGLLAAIFILIGR